MLLLIAVDGQESDGANAAFRGISSETESAIYGAVKKLHFPETVGVIVADCTQALRKPLESAGALAVAVRREAVRVEQSQWTTQSVENVLGSS